MKLSVTFKDYVEQLRARSNEALALNLLTGPFGIAANEVASEDLLIGHVLDDLADRFALEDPIDCMDVASSAFALGHEQAGDFLDEAPWLVFQATKAQHQNLLN